MQRKIVDHVRRHWLADLAAVFAIVGVPLAVIQPKAPFSTWLSVAGTVIALIAAFATIGAVYFAWRTVAEASDAAKDARTFHEEEMNDRHRAAEDELVIQRIAVLQEVLAATVELVDVARDEANAPPGNVTLGGTVTTLTKLPAMQIRLQAVVKFLSTIGGPNFIGNLPTASDGSQAGATRVWGEGVTFLRKIESNVFNNATLQISAAHVKHPRTVTRQGRPPGT